MSNIILILQNAEGTANVVAQSNSFNWTALGVILSALVIFVALCRILVKFGRFSEKFEVMSDSITKIGNNITKNTFTLKSVTTFLYTTGAEQGLFENNSPTRLTGIGEKVLDKSGGKEYIDNNLTSLIQEMENEKPNTALDVQNFSSSLLFQKIEEESFNKIKNFIYNNPEYEKVHITMAVIINVMAIYLRDQYLLKYPNLLDE